MPIKIAIIDPPITGHQNRGIGTYTKELVNALKDEKEVKVSLVKYNDNFQDFDVIHYPYFDPFFLTLPIIRKKPTVVTLHDLIPLKFPDKFPLGFKGKIKWMVQKTALKSSQKIITDSFASKKDIVRLLGIHENKIHVIYLGVGEQYRVIKSEKLLLLTHKKYNLPDNYLLHVGDVNYNKNILGLVKAFGQIIKRQPSFKLVLVGKGFTNTSGQLDELLQLVSKLQIGDRIVRIGHVSDEDLAVIYNLAKIYLQPSFAEGFGLPVLEAMACGCPVVTSNISSLPEILGDAGITVNPYKEQDIAKVCLEIFADEKKRNDLIRKGLIRTTLFSWVKCAKETIEVYKKILD